MTGLSFQLWEPRRQEEDPQHFDGNELEPCPHTDEAGADLRFPRPFSRFVHPFPSPRRSRADTLLTCHSLD
jgi:hypothetical protein